MACSCGREKTHPSRADGGQKGRGACLGGGACTLGLEGLGRGYCGRFARGGRGRRGRGCRGGMRGRPLEGVGEGAGDRGSILGGGSGI